MKKSYIKINYFVNDMKSDTMLDGMIVRVEIDMHLIYDKLD